MNIDFDFIKAKSLPDGRFVDGSFEEIRDYLLHTWNPEMFELELTNGEKIFGDEFLENYNELKIKKGAVKPPSDDKSLLN